MYTYKQIEEMLKIYPVIKAEIKNIEMDMLEVENNVGFRGATDDPKPSTPTYQFNSNVENEALSISRDRLLSNLKEEKKKRQRKIDRIENAMSILSEIEEEIISLYYFKKSSMTSISYKIDRDKSQVYRKKKYAIKKMADIMNVSRLQK
ncbi:phage transcriptional regulator, RinA family [Cellulosilyticum lentocellum]|uniref:Phage transcriptional regulator, RinA family n=1 Tax=Cellulosilyticum lentocellum (strain ATCC 49066 / DSM 5427 / NCIMB 11756 / RHM5) TaxID=642492 RepID=F2JNB8_CELLD|nr:phage transcriptional regulator, RinA family [Cellulosilyticum lentocellum]ADZ83572.1 phage transcriptional regulator, RinA family [Cellulosilyticum lentocellum DSM 5427]